MRIVFFSSGGPSNFLAVLTLALRAPELLTVAAVVADRAGTSSALVAQASGIPTLEFDFDSTCGRPGSPGYREAARQLHDSIGERLAREHEPDLIVLAYSRLIEGSLVTGLPHRIVNQHPADLSIRDEDGVRRYVGLHGHVAALRDGLGGNRTTTMFINEGMDTGEMICRGPWTPYAPVDGYSANTAAAHQEMQKHVSDTPSLQCALAAIATGRLRVISGQAWPDGCRQLTFDDKPLPYWGFDATGAVLARLLEGQAIEFDGDGRLLH
jgi:phosphoribosylglycinamide formyltransferase-1